MSSFSEKLSSGFVYLYEIIPDIQVNRRYATEENFVGCVVDGYFSNVSIMTGMWWHSNQSTRLLYQWFEFDSR